MRESVPKRRKPPGRKLAIPGKSPGEGRIRARRIDSPDRKPEELPCLGPSDSGRALRVYSSEDESADSLLFFGRREVGVFCFPKTEKAEKTEATDEKTSENTEVQEEQQPTEDESENQAEWVYDDNTGVYYHEAIGMYYDPNTGEYYDGNGTYYYWDEESQSFVEAY